MALWINTVIGVSTLFGLWALGILFRQARLHLKEQNMQAKFTCFQVSQQLTEHLKHEESSSWPERGSVKQGGGPGSVVESSGCLWVPVTGDAVGCRFSSC